MLRLFAFFSLLFLLLAPVTSRAQSSGTAASGKVTVSGYLKDAANGEALVGATVVVKSLGVGATANEYGFYSLTLPKGSYTITYTFLGYEPRT
ncbi:carboxypeptidase-like regulatory domain-containing protein [Hymenobacter cellulosilyticus]|uniref:Carboxypeptidase-like regulatory domain-containing protein n=1 Tax=Hymenobacter cellulosilyticus TaxID=2932248 RepID=A0A8T9Q8E4_9BACT|nr:carboxypeptidase-like regulatory domain-containing protein [Hymenobacter cellulosilyticus]UOQ73826.1 carboxypeptidase-like regulatory domain-containing protein [Hymenobacter cellulosilyticus]